MSEQTGLSAAAFRILVADDNVDAASCLAVLLEAMGNETRIAHDGIEAVRLAEAFQPDIILLDIGMPGLNGFDACSRIRAQPSSQGVFIVALTGWTQEETKQRSQQAGFDCYVIKPVESAMLEKILRDFAVKRG